jgi:hypothetical protein
MSEKRHLFLCHSSKDKKFVRQLAEELTELSVDVWLDEWELQPGDSLHECIGSALEHHCCLAGISQTTMPALSPVASATAI